MRLPLGPSRGSRREAALLRDRHAARSDRGALPRALPGRGGGPRRRARVEEPDRAARPRATSGPLALDALQQPALLDLRPLPRDGGSTGAPPGKACCLVQKEVAERLAAAPGTPAWGPLTASFQETFRVTMGRLVPPQLFWSRPKVDSAVFHAELREDLGPPAVRAARSASTATSCSVAVRAPQGAQGHGGQGALRLCTRGARARSAGPRGDPRAGRSPGAPRGVHGLSGSAAGRTAPLTVGAIIWPLASDPEFRRAIEEIKLRAQIESIVGETVELKQKGRDLWGCCPFHEERTPSFKVDPSAGSWYCFGACRKGETTSRSSRSGGT